MWFPDDISKRPGSLLKITRVLPLIVCQVATIYLVLVGLLKKKSVDIIYSSGYVIFIVYFILYQKNSWQSEMLPTCPRCACMVT